MKSVEEIIESLDKGLLCNYCRYGLEGCEGGIKGGQNGPIYPPCADGLDTDDFDINAYLDDLKNGEVDG